MRFYQADLGTFGLCLHHLWPNPSYVSVPLTAGDYCPIPCFVAPFSPKYLPPLFRGLLIVSKYRKERVAAIAQVLSDSSYDIVALQELWVYSDYELVKAKVVNRFPYAKFFHGYVYSALRETSEGYNSTSRGALGAGLAFFSRFPITGATSHPYSLAGSPLDVGGGDWFVGKAAVSVVLAHPTLGQLEVFNSHVSHVSASLSPAGEIKLIPASYLQVVGNPGRSI